MDLALPIALPSARRPSWRALVGALTCGLLLAGGWLWLRDSSLVSVRDIRIDGVQGAQSAQIDELLRLTARRMTTMDFDARALRSALASFPVIREVHAFTSFPHSVRIDVVERPAVAVLVATGQRTALAADGTALGTQFASAALPTLSGSFLPVPGQRVSDPTARAAVAVLGAAPLQLARFIQRVFSGPEGLTVQMRNGLLVYFGDASRPHAKWLSLARVLGDPGSTGAHYVDVRVPERPAAGLSAGQGSTAEVGSAGSSPPAGASASPTATLAERLEQATGGSNASTAGTTAAGTTATGASTAGTPATGASTTGATTAGASPTGASTAAAGGESSGETGGAGGSGGG